MRGYRIILWAFLSVLCTSVWAQMQPVKVVVSEKRVAQDAVELVFVATIDNGWHIFSTDIPAGGPVATSLKTEKAEGAKANGNLQAKGKVVQEYSKDFEMNLRYYENSATFTQRYQLTGGEYHIKGYLQYAACNAMMCMPPRSVEFDFAGEGPKKDTEIATETKQSESPATMELPQKDTATIEKEDSSDVAAILPTASGDSLDSTLPAPLTDTDDSKSPLAIFLMGIIGGLLALCTPCVWPVIPMTVSFFLKRSKDRRKGIRDAIGYGLSIIAIFMSLGITVALVGRGDWLNDLATNSIFNILLCLLMIVFALSFFGWFEIQLPSSWADRVDSKANNTSGWVSIFLMALTLVLVSFSCTAPIVGLLLVESSISGVQTGALMGMLGFALALALPFTLFALFPSWLKQLPKSGSWMNIIKVSLGFIELAFACKFFSVADMAYGWHLMDREIFLVLWIVIFTALGFYLMGLLYFQSDGPDRKAKPVPCIILGMASLAFALYMVPGLWGAPCKAVAAFAPPMSTQSFNLDNTHVEGAYTDFDEGMAAAKRTGKPVLLDFTGYGCVNCRKMEAAVWTDPAVARMLNDEYVLISLYVDDKTPLQQHEEVTNADGSKRTLRTIGDKWSHLEETRFGYLAQPFYVTLSPDGEPLSGTFAYKEDPAAFLSFLRQGLDKLAEQSVLR